MSSLHLTRCAVAAALCLAAFTSALAAKHAQAIYAEMGRKLGADDKVVGGGTDAAFASLAKTPAVSERFGLHGFGAHSNDAGYVLIDSI